MPKTTSVLFPVAIVLACAVAIAHAQIHARLDNDDGGSGIRIFFRSAWSAPHVHYSRPGGGGGGSGGWTTAPGDRMRASTDRVHFPAEAGWFEHALPSSPVEFVFNDGAGAWDNNAGKNYRAAARGWWIVTSAIAASAANPPVRVLPASDDGGNKTLRLFYRAGWSPPFVHYNRGGGGWTAAPGQAMIPSRERLFSAACGWWEIAFAEPGISAVEFAFNDGQGHWDNNSGRNYQLRAGDTGLWGLTSAVSSPPYPLVLTPTSSSPPPLPSPNPTPTPSPTATATVKPSAPPAPTPSPSTGCSNYNGQDACLGNEVDAPATSEARRWQTPGRNTTGWRPSYQDYRSLQGYAHVLYAPGRRSATVTVRKILRVPKAACVYSFNGRASSSPSASFTADPSSPTASSLLIIVTCTSGQDEWRLELEPVDFVWENTPVPRRPELEEGQRGAIVDLFGWPYKDIADECRDFLGKAGYLGVKINPPQEAVLSDAWPQGGQRNPWYFVYQPVSYRLVSRLGTRAELREMIQTCRAYGVRVYADAVVNHMVGGGNDVNARHRAPRGGGACATWGPKSSAGDSPYYTHNFAFEPNPQTGERPAAEFPAVPYGPSDFHCERALNAYTDPLILSAGWLEGLLDLNTAKQGVRERIAQYFVDLLGIGFSGFRIDALKHIGPTDTAVIMGLLATYMGGSLPADFVMWGEVILGGEAQLLACRADSGYNFYEELDRRYADAGLTVTDIAKLKIWSSDYPKEHPACGRWILPASRFVIQNDDHDQQQPGSTSRDMGDKGSVLVKHRDVAAHRGFELELFNRRDADWKIRVVLSSYTIFPDNTPAGFPDGHSDCATGFDPSAGQECTRSVPYERAFRAGSCGSTVEGFRSVGKYTRVHRDLPIVNAMRVWLGLHAVSAKELGISSGC